LKVNKAKEPAGEGTYSAEAQRRGIGAPDFTQPRVNSLLSCMKAVKGVAFWNKNAVLDLSQSVGMNRFRADGKLFCLSTGSQPYLPGKGYVLVAEDLMFLMGFPTHEHKYQAAMSAVGTQNLRRLVGNTMDVRVVSFVVLAAMYADATP
jgi:hypothetical protein